MSATRDVVVIGGGVVGLCIAGELAGRGVHVTVVDAGAIAGAASSRNGGQLSPGIDGAWAPIARRALELWPALGERLGDIGYVREGGLYLVMSADATTPEEIVAYRRERGFVAETLTPAECARRLPGLAREIKGGVFSPKHGQVDPFLATRALAREAESKGVRLLAHAPVIAIDTTAGRVEGVRTDRERVVADVVVDAAGPWADQVSALAGVRVPVAPRRIEIVASESLAPITRMVWGGNGLYCRQDARGRLHFGAEGPPWDPPARHFMLDVTAPTLQRIGRRMLELVPGLAGVGVTHAWSGIIAPTPDLMPVIDLSAGPSGFVIAAAFAGNGFGTAPAVGEIVADLITTGRSTFDVTPLALDRFAGVSAV